MLLSKTAFAEESTVSLAPMLEKIMPAVVNISARGIVNIPPGLRDRSNPQEEEDNNEDDNMVPPEESGPGYPSKRRFESMGSGVIIDANHGYILTNAHLVRDTNDITVTLSDGRRLTARLIGIDTASDVAVLHIKADRLQSLPLADSDNVRVGDFVAAIGNPFGLKQTVTSGIVSGLERSDIGIEGYEDFIQTDAPINPGNSGGALVDRSGRLVGINTAILAPGGGNIGIGFAIPVNMAVAVMKQLVEHGQIQRGVVGVMVQTLTPELADGFKVSGKSGALVTEVKAYSSAQAANLKVGDIITSVNNKSISSANQVRNIIGLMPIGNQMRLTVLRDGKPLTLSPKVMDPKAYQQVAERNNPFLFGAIYNDFNIHTSSMGDIRGIQLLQLTDESPLARANLHPGDIIVAVNGEPTPDYPALQKIAQNTHEKTLVVHAVRADGQAFYKVVNRS
jgi:serine protease Do